MQSRGFFMQFFNGSLIPDEVFDGGVEGGEGVGEAVVDGDFGGDALAVEKESGLIAEEGFEQWGGHGQDGGAVQGLGQRAGEFGIGDGMGANHIHDPVPLRVGGGGEQQAGDVIDVHPGCPLAAGSEASTEAAAKDGVEDGPGAAAGSEHEADAPAHDADADGLGAQGFDLPRLSDVG